jgi:hypothetical protein
MLGLYHISYCPEVDRQNSCARGGVLVSKRKAQLAPGFPTIRDLGVVNFITNGHVSSLSGRNGPATMASGIITSKYFSHLTHLTD